MPRLIPQLAMNVLLERPQKGLADLHPPCKGCPPLARVLGLDFTSRPPKPMEMPMPGVHHRPPTSAFPSRPSGRGPSHRPGPGLPCGGEAGCGRYAWAGGIGVRSSVLTPFFFVSLSGPYPLLLVEQSQKKRQAFHGRCTFLAETTCVENKASFGPSTQEVRVTCRLGLCCVCFWGVPLFRHTYPGCSCTIWRLCIPLNTCLLGFEGSLNH